MRDFRRPLLPPSTPPALPYGLQRGGIFDAPYVPPTYIDQRRQTVPTDSPATHMVSEDVFANPVAFSDPARVRMVTGPLAGFGQNVQGMLPNRREVFQSANLPALPINAYHALVLAHGATKGGIFGRGQIIGDASGGHRVPMRPPGSAERYVLEGYGIGPDGLGRFG